MKIYETVPPNLQRWALQQPLFFTASAPLHGRHVNCSPKGLPGATFTIFDESHCAYVDATGSGSETISHIYENGRVTLMWCSFDKLPRIMRWFCHGSVIELGDARWWPTLRRMGIDEPIVGARAIIMLSVWKCQTSCGTGVPIIGEQQTREEAAENDDGAEDGLEVRTTAKELLRDRTAMVHWCEGMEKRKKMKEWQTKYNANSLDGLTGMRKARRDAGQILVVEDLRLWLVRMAQEWQAVLLGLFLGVCLVVLGQQLELVPCP